MKEWGWTNPVLADEAGGVIAGHARILAARQLGIAPPPDIAPVPFFLTRIKCACPAKSEAGARENCSRRLAGALGFGPQEASQPGLITSPVIARPVPEFEEAFELLRSELRHGNHVFGMSRSDPELLQGRHLAGERYALTALDTLAPLFGGFDLFRGCRDEGLAPGDHPFGGFEPGLVLLDYCLGA